MPRNNVALSGHDPRPCTIEGYPVPERDRPVTTMFFNAFTRLFRSGTTPTEPTNELLRDLDKVETFPTLSGTTARALAVINDPGTALADLAELIRRDGVLAAAVLKVANSAAYRGRSPTETLSQATTRLGMRGCHRVVAAVAVRDTFRPVTPAVAGPCEALLRHALFTGALAVRISAAGELGFRGEEFTAGLLHDIGRVILCARAPNRFARVDPLTFREGADVVGAERSALDTDHCEIGFCFARANALPQPIAGAILHHHEPAAAKTDRLLVAVTAAADALANHVQCERTLAGFEARSNPGFALLFDLAGASAATAIWRARSAAVVGALRETRAMLRGTEN